MNLVYENPCVPIRVLLVNATHEVQVMIAIKALRGVLFGPHQLIDLTLLVYANDIPKAEALKWNLEGGAFPCNNSITITSDIPRITDADVFIFISNFRNPNLFELDMVDDDDYFDSLYLFLKIANNFEMDAPGEEPQEEKKKRNKNLSDQIIKPIRPIILTDGIVALDIIKTFSRNLPDDIFFCPNSLSEISKSILGDYLKVKCNKLNYLYIWAANDTVFHVDVEHPLYIPEKTSRRGRCEWDVMGDLEFEQLNIDFTQFNAAWLKNDFINKISSMLSNHRHGNIYKSAKVAKSLQGIWKTRSLKPDPVYKCNIGVISDGTLGTIKGNHALLIRWIGAGFGNTTVYTGVVSSFGSTCDIARSKVTQAIINHQAIINGIPYFLPVIFHGDTFILNEHLKDDIHLKQEMKRINKAALDQHQLMTRYCKKFLQKNVIRYDFILAGEGSDLEFTTAGTSSSVY